MQQYKYIVLIAVVVTAVISSVLIPKLFLPKNSEQFSGQDGVFALHAIKQFQNWADFSDRYYITQSIRVTKLESFELEEGTSCETHPADDGKTFYLSKGYRAKVVGYSFWGIPYHTSTIGCSNAQ